MSDTDLSLSLSEEAWHDPSSNPTRAISVRIPDSALRRPSSAWSEAPPINLSPRIVISPTQREPRVPLRANRSRGQRQPPKKASPKRSSPQRNVIETQTYRLTFPKHMDGSSLTASSTGHLSERSRRQKSQKKRGKAKAKAKDAPSSSQDSSSDTESEDEPRQKSKRPSQAPKKRPKPGRGKRKPTVDNIEIQTLMFPSDIDAEGGSSVQDDYEPPRHLSPRSAADYARKALKKSAQKRRKRKRRKKDGEDRKKRKRKKSRGQRKKKDEDSQSDDDGIKVAELKPVPEPREHFYQTPRQLYKKRCVFVSEQMPVKCSICTGLHYRTKRNFASNLRIIANVNRALVRILAEMRNRIRTIDANLVKVKKNLEYLEDMYEGVFRRVNRLIA